MQGMKAPIQVAGTKRREGVPGRIPELLLLSDLGRYCSWMNPGGSGSLIGEFQVGHALVFDLSG